MTREDCQGCEFFGKGSVMFDECIPVCKHKSLLHGAGVWIARVKECPKKKDGENENFAEITNSIVKE